MPAAVLVVDDEADLVRTYERVLRRQGHHVISAGSRQEALTALASRPLDLIVTDVRLGGEDGLDVVRASRGAGLGPPVIVVTGSASKAGRHDALAAGAADYLAKPFSVAQLVGAVESVLGGPRSA
jgi:DNA-binding response OmpR family regulator